VSFEIVVLYAYFFLHVINENDVYFAGKYLSVVLVEIQEMVRFFLKIRCLCMNLLSVLMHCDVISFNC